MNCFHLVTNALQSAVFMETVHHPAQFTFFSELYLWKQPATPLHSRSSVRGIYGNSPTYHSIHVLRWGVFMEKPTTPLNSRASANCICGNSAPYRSTDVLRWTVFMERVCHPAQFTLFSEMYQFMETVHHTAEFTVFSELYCGNNPPPCLIYIFQCLSLCTFSPSYL